MVKNSREESGLASDWAAWPISLALAAMGAGAALISHSGDLAAQSAGQNTLQAQIQRYGCNLPQYANSVPACRELRARAQKSRGAARPSYSSPPTPAPGPPRASPGGGFFATLFGGGNTARRANASAPRYSSFTGARSRKPLFGPNGWSGAYSSRMSGGGRYRTLCVRSCDGYYWPVSFSTSRAGFSRDAKQCVNSCGAPAKLFVHPNPGADIAQMVDLGGKPYSRTENAFRYREEYVKDCRCKPEPWSEAAKQDYATRAERAENPAPVKMASTRQTKAPDGVTAPAYPPAARPQTSNRKKPRWRVRSDEADFSGQWWAGSW